MTRYWLIDPTTLPAPTARKRKLGRKPLIDLASLQQAIRTGALGEDDVLLGTIKAERNLGELDWFPQDVLDCIACLDPADHRNAAWCQDSDGDWHACDDYAIHYDETAKRRLRHSDINFYLKFSISENGDLSLILISCHL